MHYKRPRYCVSHLRPTMPSSQSLRERVSWSVVGALLTETRLEIVQIGTPSEFAFGGDSRLIDLYDRCFVIVLPKVIVGSVFDLGVDCAPFQVAAMTSANIVILCITARAEHRRPSRDFGDFGHSTTTSLATGAGEQLPCEAPSSSLRGETKAASSAVIHKLQWTRSSQIWQLTSKRNRKI